MFIKYGMHIELSLYFEMQLISSHLKGRKKALAQLTPVFLICGILLSASGGKCLKYPSHSCCGGEEPLSLLQSAQLKSADFQLQICKAYYLCSLEHSFDGRENEMQIGHRAGICSTLANCQKKATKTQGLATQTQGWNPRRSCDKKHWPESPIVPIKI